MNIRLKLPVFVGVPFHLSLWLSFCLIAPGIHGTHLSCFTLCICVSRLLIELPDPNLGMGASGTQASGGAVVPKGSNKRRAA